MGGNYTKEGNTAMDNIVLQSPNGASATVRLHGGKVVSWRNDRGEELLFTSSKQSPQGKRGGISIFFPKFGDREWLNQYGFASNRIWSIDGDSREESSVHLRLERCSDVHNLEFSQQIALKRNGDLVLIPRIKNLNTRSFSFTFGYHTHLSVSDISDIRVEDLETLHYLDNLHGKGLFTEQGDALTVDSEVDRVYINTPPCVKVLDHGIRRTCIVRKTGLPDIVVWNPWMRTSKSISDFGNNEYMKMICVDASAVQKSITLKPGEEWSARLELASSPTS